MGGTNGEMINFEFRGQKFYFVKTRDAEALIKEIFSDNYKVLSQNITFDPGDVIVDLGANEGMFSIMMSKIYPQTKIFALEPVPRTYYQMLRNIGLNGCKNIEHHCLGVGKKGEYKKILNVSKDFSGGSTAVCTYNPDHHDRTEVNVMGLDEFFTAHGIDRCKLLKVDIEGMEYDALYASTILPKVEFVTGEFHMNHKLEFLGRRMDALATWVGNQSKLIHIDLCRMAE